VAYLVNRREQMPATQLKRGKNPQASLQGEQKRSVLGLCRKTSDGTEALAGFVGWSGGTPSFHSAMTPNAITLT